MLYLMHIGYTMFFSLLFDILSRDHRLPGGYSEYPAVPDSNHHFTFGGGLPGSLVQENKKTAERLRGCDL